MRFGRTRGLAVRIAGVSASALIIVGVTGGLWSPASAGHGGPNHWNKSGNARVVLYFDDKTGAAWPVGTAVTQWANAASSTGADITPYYRTTCPGTGSSTYCAPVNEYSDSVVLGAVGCEGLRGCTVWTNNASSHFTSIAVWLNNTGAGDSTQRRTTACHELGHALGLATSNTTQNHPTASDTCLRAAVPYNAGPNAHDANALYNTYNHSS